jgi:DNA-binding PadR family transcriptional regulator
VLLGLLSESPRTGYDLERAIRLELDPVWSAGFSQIYPELSRLRRRGWVLLRVLGPRRGPRRNLYRATAAGRRELHRWLQEPPDVPRANDGLLVRLAFTDALSPGERRRTLAAADESLAAEIERLRSLPPAGPPRSLPRRAAIERHESLRRFLRSAGAAPAGAGARVPSGRPRKKR